MPHTILNLTVLLTLIAGLGLLARHAVRPLLPRRKDSPQRIRTALNRLIVACEDETLALDAAVRILESSARKARLSEQAERRRIFRGDISAAVVALGGLPASGASRRARVLRAARVLKGVVAGRHEGDAYATCARATEKTSVAYRTVLELGLSSDVRYGIERQSAEVDHDRAELRRLRWGGRLSPAPLQEDETESGPASVARLRSDARALETWVDEGGPEQLSARSG